MADPEIPLSAIDFSKLASTPLENVLLALLTLVIGYIIIKYVLGRIVTVIKKSSKMPEVMLNHLTRAISFLLYLMVVLAALSFLGINVNTIIISISAFLALILGFGMQDTVNNIASGIWIVSFNAFDKGDEVDVAGVHGTVMDVALMETEIKKLDNTRVMIPNSKIWNGPIINVTKMPTRMIVQPYGIGYGSSLDTAIKVALNVAAKHEKVHSTPAPIVRVREMADSSLNLQLRAWTDTDDYYPTKSDIIKMLFEDLTEAGIEIPFPQMDVHMKE